jgi:hypothetical protein
MTGNWRAFYKSLLETAIGAVADALIPTILLTKKTGSEKGSDQSDHKSHDQLTVGRRRGSEGVDHHCVIAGRRGGSLVEGRVEVESGVDAIGVGLVEGCLVWLRLKNHRRHSHGLSAGTTLTWNSPKSNLFTHSHTNRQRPVTTAQDTC